MVKIIFKNRQLFSQYFVFVVIQVSMSYRIFKIYTQLKIVSHTDDL